MSKATTQEQTSAGVPGVRFTTDARPGTAQEASLQKIQSELSGGQTSLPDVTDLPHLHLYEAKTEDGSSYTMIALWVPAEKRSKAATLLEDAGFTVAKTA